CAEPLAETRPCHAAQATGTVPSTQTAISSSSHETDERKTNRIEQASDEIFASFHACRAVAGRRRCLVAKFPSIKKVLKKGIDTKRRNLVSRAPGSETDEGFYPVGSLAV